MLKACEDISTTKKRLKIEIPAETLETEINKTLREVQRRTKLPGFRPGKSPMTIIEKRFGKEVEAEVLDKLVSEHFLKAIKEAGITPVSRPEMEEPLNFKRSEPLSMVLTLEVRPVVEGLNYEGIAVKDIPIEIKDEDIDTVIRNLSEEKAPYESVDDAATEGDLVTVDYKETVENTTAKDVVFKVGGGPYPREFFDAVIGKKKGEESAAAVTFPADSQTPFAGKNTKFELTIKEIKRRNLPVVDDEFAKDLGFEDLKALKAKVGENMTADRVREAGMLKHKEILTKLLEAHKFEVPEGPLKSELEAMVRNTKNAGKDERPDETLYSELKPEAERRVRASFILEIIGEKEGVTVSEEDMKNEVLALSQRFYVSPDNVVKYYTARDGSLDSLRSSVFERKVMDLLLGKATVEEGGQ